MKILYKILMFIRSFFVVFISWISEALKQSMASYCEIQTADSETVLVTDDGSLLSIIDIKGVRSLTGREEFDHIMQQLQQTLQSSMKQPGHVMQMFYSYDRSSVKEDLADILSPAKNTAKRLGMKLDDLFAERESHIGSYCAHEDIYLVMWTRLKTLSSQELKAARKSSVKFSKQNKVPFFRDSQNPAAAVSALRESHDTFVRGLVSDFDLMGIESRLLDSHVACRVMRQTVDPDFTAREWSPQLPGDKIMARLPKKPVEDISDVLWQSLKRQLMPRDAIVRDLRTVQIGDRIYSTVFIDLFPRNVQSFVKLQARTMRSLMPWRISFLLESDAMRLQGLRRVFASVLGFTSQQNRLISGAVKLLDYLNLNTDDAVVRLKVAASTWAPVTNPDLLISRTSQLARAIEGWGSCDVSQVCGDPFQGVASSMLGIMGTSVAPASLAPLSNALYMMPFFRPASHWEKGAVLFRSPDGRPLPYQPGSSKQTTWIDLFYARPGSGKSVLSNAMNLAVCLAPGLSRLPRIAIIDIGPSSSGLISLLKDSLPFELKSQVVHHRLRMTQKYAINPFDTQLGSRYPTPQERAFLVNFLTLLVTPIGQDHPYDGVADMAGLVVDELFKQAADKGNPNTYTAHLAPAVDNLLEEIGFYPDAQTSWWEITDALFVAGFPTEAELAQRQAVPVLPDIASICRMPAVKDLYGKLITPTGENLIDAFARMVSAAAREYPIISQKTQFSFGDARVVALDLDEVARSGGDAANRQTAVMYMLARHVLARHYFLVDDNVEDMPETYRSYHRERIRELREDPKRIVYDEFHRTSNAFAVREQVVRDMREGRKWKVQIALLSQSIEDFDEVMVEFATSIFIMDAGPEQAVRKTSKVFGLSQSARTVLKNRVHGPREGGSTFLAQFSTKVGINTHLLTSTLGPIELWALNTTAEDVNLRNHLYRILGAAKARRVLAKQFPSGSAVKALEERYNTEKEEGGLLDDESKASVFEEFLKEIIAKAELGAN